MRFLACVVCNPKNTPSLRLELFNLKYAKNPEEVTYPTETIAFVFIEAESVDIVYERFIVFKLNDGFENFLISDVQPPLYLVGEKIEFSGRTFVLNGHSGMLMPFNEGDVVIPE